jgi:Na+/proline symporter
MNAAILGYYYGFVGTLAYAAYYLSFLTGAYVIGHLRRAGMGSVQHWLTTQFGPIGATTYTIVIALRLLSEVFANLLVVGLIFSALAPDFAGASTLAIVMVAGLGLLYSAWGGLSAALRTDVVQMSVFLVVFVVALTALFASGEASLATILTSQGVAGSYNGWVLLAVAALQVFSYPLHDPVMMDRGFIAGKATTRASFLHAFWVSTLCIIGFGMFGIQAAILGAPYEGELIGTWAQMFPSWVFAALMLSLLVSALSTLDSALASAARISVEELRLVPRSLAGGRLAMLVFTLLGTALTIWGNSSLFDAVAISGTASLFLTPILIAGLVLNRQIALWAYMVSYGAALLGAMAYLFRAEASVARILPEGHKYEQLLLICLVVLMIGGLATLIGSRKRERVAAP